MLERIKIYSRIGARLLEAVSPFGQKIVVNEFPKSGGTWLCSSISAATGYTFSEQRLVPCMSSCVLHTHRFWFSDVASSQDTSLYLVRNPFDVYISLYYHCLFYNDKANRLLVDHCKSVMGEDFSPSNFAQSFHNFLLVLYDRGFSYIRPWDDHVRSVDFNRTRVVRYEDLWDDNERVVTQLLSSMNIMCDKQSLKSYSANSRKAILSARQQFDNSGLVSSGSIPFSRRGGYGSWRSSLDDRHIDFIYRKVQSQLSLFDYQDMISHR